MSTLSVVLAGGGTAGHTSPLIATAQALEALHPGVQLTCVGTPKGLEKQVIPAAGLTLRMIPPVPLPRKPTPDLLKVPFRLRTAVRQAGKILAEAKAQVVVGFGGYVSLPVYLAAKRRRIPVVIHEQNAVPGLANRVAARFAAATLVSFPGTPLPGAQLTGLPLRAQVSELARAGRTTLREQAAQNYELDPGMPVLLVSGGSQGARSINQATLGMREDLLSTGVQILHVLGPRNMADEIVPVTDPKTGASYRPLGYVDDMAQAYAAADLMVARSGAGTVAETAAVGLPCVFVPLPHGNGEQARNAAPLIEADVGVLINDSELSPQLLRWQVLDLLDDSDRLAQMGRRAAELLAPGAAERVARIVLGVVEGSTNAAA
jgi:UDP-N-acetylglucosamine--N-acetylmuramyl-(pentapeptide) pyrophosphoryl-undecaprenol N-acetylglucosamine transferase